MLILARALDGYLAMRRSLGYKLEQDGKLLARFVAYIEDSGLPFITISAAVTFATQPVDASPNTRARRLAVVRRFAQHVCTLDPRTEVPPAKLLPYRAQRPTPYLYSEHDLQALMEAARKLRASAFRRATTSTLIGAITVTGMRMGEAIGLDRSDFDRHEGILTIQAGKFGKSREVVLHDTATAALHAYERRRDRTLKRPKSSAFFLSQVGTRLHRQNVSQTFSRVLRRAGLSDRKPRRPRLHDLRHTFAIRTLLDWYRAGADVEARLPQLSTYLGHVSPSSTYWYLTAVPELLGLAAQRLERFLGEEP